eukprot:8420135-Karenia_brevis.AAC.1
MDVVCPQDIKAMALMDSETAMWHEWTSRAENSSLAPRPYVQPLVQYIAAQGHSVEKKRAAVGLVTQGAVTQTVLHEWGKVDSPNCLLCGEAGTPHHRLWMCKGLNQLRQTCRWTYQHLGAQASPESKLHTRGLMPEHVFAFRPVDDAMHCKPDEDGNVLFQRAAYTDGSLLSKHRRGGQCGWAVVGGAADARVISWGPMPAQLPVQKRILRAELWALLMALRSCMPPISIYVDCAGVVQGVQMGKA